MTDPKADTKQEAGDRALATGGIPLDPYPGYLTWFFRAFVDAGGGSELDSLCQMFPGREFEILQRWCSLAEKDRWAWDQARAKLKEFVVSGQSPPLPLAKFAIVARPASKSGPGAERAQDIRAEFFARVLGQEGFKPEEVNQQFDESFPSPGRKDPGSTLRKRRTKDVRSSLRCSKPWTVANRRPRRVIGRRCSSTTGASRSVLQ